MARKKQDPTQVDDYRHDAPRKNLPPAGLASQGKVQEMPRARYEYDPHLPPILRFDETGEADRLPELLEKATHELLTPEEARLLADALRTHQPWLEWAGKREARWFEVDPVALHIHERLSTQAILKLAQRQPMQRSLWADPELEYRRAVQFYQHDVDWANRLILGDSLTVMHSLARREDLAGKVQMIYFDPPYGINYASNFQPTIGKRDVKDRAEDLTREPEQVKAYRDTWRLGVHSYLAYLRDRFIVARELLTESGSIFVQISDENVHFVRNLLDEVFGREHFVSQILFRKKLMPLGAKTLESMGDYLIWYAKDRDSVKYHQLYAYTQPKPSARWTGLQLSSGARQPLSTEERRDLSKIPHGSRVYGTVSQAAPSYSDSGVYPFEFQGQEYLPPQGQCWLTTAENMKQLAQANRLEVEGELPRYVMFHEDFPLRKITNPWTDTAPAQKKKFVVQTNRRVIERCMLMTTDPGDLVLDPTCGSGTTAYVAEQWGRRWITIDTSRVAVAIARQRLLTAKFAYYELADPNAGVTGGFVYKTVPHITLKCIAQNQALDPIFARWEPVLAKKRAALNAALGTVTPEIRTRLQAKLLAKERDKGKRAVTDADRRRWLLPKEGWQEWEAPYDADPDWPQPLQAALEDYRAVWRAKMDEVNATIAASAPQETLYDQPQVAPNVVRVSGPFTVEGVHPVEESLDLDSPIGGAPEELPTFAGADEPANAEAYLDKMIRLLRTDGVRFPDNKVVQFDRLEPLALSMLHAEGVWGNGEGKRRVAVAFGPQYGPITAQQVEESLREAYRRAFEDLIFAGFTIDGAAQAIIQDDPNPRVRIHLAHIRPDVNMGGLLKDTPSSQLFTVFGLPRVQVETTDDGQYIVEMEGVDIYDPVTNTLRATKADKVAAWFLDGDYDGQTFCISQAFFPDRGAWEKLAKALKTTVDARRFAAFSGTRSLPFPAGDHQRIAVKVIYPRGNEVMRVMSLGEVSYA